MLSVHSKLRKKLHNQLKLLKNIEIKPFKHQLNLQISRASKHQLDSQISKASKHQLNSLMKNLNKK